MLTNSVNIYIAFADRDRQGRDQLVRQLKFPITNRRISVWHRDLVPPGGVIAVEMQRQLLRAHVVVLLVSADLISERNEEVLAAVARRSSGADVIPVLLRSTETGGGPFTGLCPLPYDGVPIAKKSDRDEAWVEVVVGLLGIVDVAYARINPPPPPPGTAVILFLGSNPSNANEIATRTEFEAVEQRLARSPNAKKFQLRLGWAVTTGDLIETIRDHRPAILHFSGHGTQDGRIVLVNEDGKKAPVTQRALAQVMRVLRDVGLRCVVLNACYSDQQAPALVDEVGCVLGVTGQVADKTAIAFSAGFYAGLASGENVERAADWARAQAALTGQGMEDILKLITRPDVSASEIRFV